MMAEKVSENCPLAEAMRAHLKPPMQFKDQDAGSQVAEFYDGRSVFITGATGFIGKALIEKLVRSCPNIRQIFVLVREKRGLTPAQRLDKLIKAQYFDRIRLLNDGSSGPLEERLRPICGDITRPMFGISAADMALLSANCTLVFNVAASVRFVEPLEMAAKNNVYSAGQLVEVCNQLERLQAIVHVSTAYANCHKLDLIEEILYEPPLQAEQLFGVVEKCETIQRDLERPNDGNDDHDGASAQSGTNALKVDLNSRSDFNFGKLLAAATRVLLQRSNRPNTYTFTKAIAESHLAEKLIARPDKYLNSRVQVAIVRPSIVGSAWREPCVGMLDGFQGPAGVIANAYTGSVQAMFGTDHVVADVVPVDLVANMLACTAWQLAQPRDKWELRTHRGICLFNFVSGARNPTTWRLFAEKISGLTYAFPSKFMGRVPSFFFMPSSRLFELYDFFNHKCPALLMDLLSGKRKLERRNYMSEYRRVRQVNDLLAPFGSNEWKFSDANVQTLANSLNEADKSLFHFDVAAIEWPKYVASYVIGTRIYALRDTSESLPAARTKLRTRRLVFNISTMMLMALLLFFIFRI